MVRPEMIDASLVPMMKDSSINEADMMAVMETLEEFENANGIKVVVDRYGDVLYFSREPIPSLKKGADIVPMLK